MSATTIDEARMDALTKAAFSAVQAPDDLCGRVLGRIREEERGRDRRAARAHGGSVVERPARRMRVGVRVAAAVTASALTVTAAYAAVSSGFLQSAFGDKGQPDVAARTVPNDGSPYTLPSMTWEGTDEATAERLVGAYVTESGGTVTTAGVTLTVGGVVVDENGLGVATYTLRGPQAVLDSYGDAGYGELYVQPDTPVRDVMVSGPTERADEHGVPAVYDERSVVDRTRSTDGTLCAVSYFASDDPSQAGEEMSWWLPQTGDNGAFAGESVSVTPERVLPATTFETDEGASNGVDAVAARVSPIGVTIDVAAGTAGADAGEEASPTAEVCGVSLGLSDGSTYVVEGGDVMNRTLDLQRRDGSVAILFNRLVDPAAVTSVSVTVRTFEPTARDVDVQDASALDVDVRAVETTHTLAAASD